MITEERKFEILDKIDPIINDQELVKDGTGSNYRPLKLTYQADDCEIIETRQYRHETCSPSWKLYQSLFEIKEVTGG